MAASLRPLDPVSPADREPSTDFPTPEDEVPCPRARRWPPAAAWTALGLAARLVVGFLIARALGCG